MEFKGSENWRLRKVNGGFFFIEADLPNAKQNGHYPRLEVMQEDFGEHNGYTYQMRLADAQLIAKAPEMLEELNDTIDDLKILKSNILDASKTNNRWEGMADVIQNWIDRKEELVKSATSLDA